MLEWIDSHAHFCDERYLKDFPAYYARLKPAGVSRVLIITLTAKEYEMAVEIQAKYPGIDIAFGFHPEAVSSLTETDWLKLEEIIQAGKLVAIGEIGLDYYWTKDNQALQKAVFKRQLALANQYNLPVIIHLRDSLADTYQILKQAKVYRGGIMHCYTGDSTMAKKIIELGFLIAVGGIVTFKNGQLMQAVVQSTPLEYLLIETDSPYLAPVPYRGKLNEPSYVALVGAAVAKLKDLPEKQVSQQLKLNYTKLFQLNI